MVTEKRIEAFKGMRFLIPPFTTMSSNQLVFRIRKVIYTIQATALILRKESQNPSTVSSGRKGNSELIFLNFCLRKMYKMIIFTILCFLFLLKKNIT